MAEKAGVPSQLIPVAVVKLFSSSAATGLALDIFKGIRAGFPDRIDGIAATFLYRNYFLYDESVFYGSRGQKTRYTLPGR